MNNAEGGRWQPRTRYQHVPPSSSKPRRMYSECAIAIARGMAGATKGDAHSVERVISVHSRLCARLQKGRSRASLHDDRARLRKHGATRSRALFNKAALRCAALRSAAYVTRDALPTSGRSSRTLRDRGLALLRCGVRWKAPRPLESAHGARSRCGACVPQTRYQAMPGPWVTGGSRLPCRRGCVRELWCMTCARKSTVSRDLAPTAWEVFCQNMGFFMS